MRREWIAMLTCVGMLGWTLPAVAQDGAPPKKTAKKTIPTLLVVPQGSGTAPQDKKAAKKKATAGLIIPGKSRSEQQDEQAKSPLAKRLSEILGTWRTTQNEFYARYRKASAEEREALSKEYPKPGGTAKALMALAREHPKTEEAAKALFWVAANMSREDSAMSSQALDALFRDHKQSPVMGRVAKMLSRSDRPEDCKRLERLRADAKDPKARAKITYYLASACKKAGDKKKARQYFQECAQSDDVILYRDVSVGAKAEKELFDLDHLQIGMVAPDIQGEDEDGVAFKLSDYRGKVVLLDFWGHW